MTNMLWNKDRLEQFFLRKDDQDFQVVDEWERSVIKHWISLLSCNTVLDAPCGYGRLFKAFGEKTKIIGIDANHEMCVRAYMVTQQFALNVKIIQANLLTINIPTVDISVCVRLWTHLEEACADRLFANLLAASPCVILHINENNDTAESQRLKNSGNYRLDTIYRIEDVAKKLNARICMIERLKWSTACLLLIKRDKGL